MGIFGALTTAVTGMRAQAFALENISGNIANSQTTAFKRIDTSFVDLIPDGDPTKQLAGNVVANSRATNTVQGDIQSASITTFMAINGQGFFVVEKPDNFVDNRPSFSGVDLYSRRGDFQLDQNGYLVNGAGYYLMGIPVDPTTGNLSGSVPTILQFQNGFLPAQATTNIDYRANLASYPLTPDHNTQIPGSELLNQSNFSANPVAGVATAAKIIGSGATLLPDAQAVLTGSVSIASLVSVGGNLVINGTPVAIAPGDNAAAILADINGATGTTGVSATPRSRQQARSHQRGSQNQYRHRARHHIRAFRRTRPVGRHHQRHQSAHAGRGGISTDFVLHGRRQSPLGAQFRYRPRPDPDANRFEPGARRPGRRHRVGRSAERQCHCHRHQRHRYDRGRRRRQFDQIRYPHLDRIAVQWLRDRQRRQLVHQ